MPPEKAQPYIELNSRSAENTTPEGKRFNEAQEVAGVILNQRAEEICSQLDREKRGPKTDTEQAYYFFRALKNLPPKPDGSSGTPEPQNEQSNDSKPLNIRIIERQVAGKRVFQVAQSQEGTGGQMLEVKALQYRDGDMVYITGERKSKGGAKIKVNYAIPLADLQLAQLSSESDVIMNDTGLSTEQRDMLNLANESFKKGLEPIRDPKAVDAIAEGARSSGLLSRSSLEKFIAARGVSVPTEKLDRILGGNSIAKPNQAIEIMDAAGFFDKNQLKIMVQDAERAVSSTQAAMTAAEQKVQGLQSFEGKAVGDKIPQGDTEIEITQADIDTLNTAKTELANAQKAALEAIDELKELKATESQAADPKIRGALETYLNRIQNGEVSSDSGLAFVRAMESNDAEGIFNAVMEEELKKIADEQEREAKRKLMKEKYAKYNEKALQAGGVALMILLILMKDAAKQ